MTFLLNGIVIVFFPLLFLGLINQVKAFWEGRIGPSILQPALTMFKLLRKGVVMSQTTSWIFRIAPMLTLATTFTALLLVPLVNQVSFLSFEGNFIVFLYLFSLGKFWGLLGALDTGGTFEGMGASREMLFSIILEPAILLVLAVVSFVTQTSSFASIMTIHNAHPESIVQLITLLSVLALFLMMLIEGCRVPVDDPKTHLELTMVHESMILDYSGPDLAMIQYNSALKMVAIGALIANMMIKTHANPFLSFGYLILFIGAFSVIIGTIESGIARLKLIQVPKFLFFVNSLAFIIAALVFLYMVGGMH